MGWKEFMEHPLSGVRDWVREHERTLIIGTTWGAAAVFFVIAVVYLLKTLRSL